MYIEAINYTEQDLKHWAGNEIWNIYYLVQFGLSKGKSLLFRSIFPMEKSFQGLGSNKHYIRRWHFLHGHFRPAFIFEHRREEREE